MWTQYWNSFAQWPTSAACLTYEDMWRDSATLALDSDVPRQLTASWPETLPMRTKLVSMVRMFRNALFPSGEQCKPMSMTDSGRR